MSEWKTIKNIEKIEPEGFEECGLPKAPYYVIHYEDGMAQQVSTDANVLEENDAPVITKEEFLSDLDCALKDLKLNMEGKLKFRPIEELFAELEREDEDV